MTVTEMLDDIRRNNRTLARAHVLFPDGRDFDFAGTEHEIARMEARLQDALEASPLYDWANESPARIQHLRFNLGTETYTVCDGPRPARS